MRTTCECLYHAMLMCMFLTGCSDGEEATTSNLQNESTANRPNMVIFVADDLNWDDLGVYGNTGIVTPNIDALARSGMVFTRAYLTTSSCSPSRASILSGLYPHNTGAMHLNQPLPPETSLFTAQLKRHGYYTAVAGKWHLGPDAKRAFHEVLESSGPGGADDWLQVVRDRPHDAPFFLWLAATDPHRPYLPEDHPDAAPALNNPGDVQLPPYIADTPLIRDEFALYYDEITRFDSNVGVVVEELRYQGVLENTLILVISDNGRSFPRGKTTLSESGVKTPLIVHWPDSISPGHLNHELVSVIDIAPTLLELAGITTPETLPGRSLKPTLFNSATSIRDYAFSEQNWHGINLYDRSVRSNRYLYVKNGEATRHQQVCAIDGSETFEEMLRLHSAGFLLEQQQYCFSPRPAEELYDLTSDPYNLNNLVDDIDYAEPLNELRNKLLEWQIQTEDHDYEPYSTPSAR